MDGKKLSFGFTKTAKKPSILATSKKEENTVQLIECLEGQSIKIKDAMEEVKTPLIIPLKESKQGILHQLKQKQLENNGTASITKPTNQEEQKMDSELTLDELAARELINDAQIRLTKPTAVPKVMRLPMAADHLPLDGESEPTLDDYESVPITEYGMAMLRGMGWNEGMSIGKNTSNLSAVAAPELRPKGLGLGATKVVQSETPKNKATDKDGKELQITKGAFAKVIAGAQKGNYCEVQGYDNEEGRIIVKIFPKGHIINVNELLLTPVTKEEFSKGSKVLNNAKYEEYKEQSDIKLEKYRDNKIKSEDFKEDSSHSNRDNYKEKKEHKEDKYKVKERRKYSSESSENDDKYSRSKNYDYRETRTNKDRDLVRNRDDNLGSKAKARKEKYRDSSSEEEKSKYRRSRSKERLSKHKSTFTEPTKEQTKKSSKSRRKPSSEEDIENNRDKSKERSRKNKSKHRDSSEEKRPKSTKKNRDRSRSNSPKEKRSKTKKKYKSESESSSEERGRRKNKTKSRDRRRSKSSDEKKQSRNHSKSSKYENESREKNKKKKSKSKHRKSSSCGSESSTDNDDRYKSRR